MELLLVILVYYEGELSYVAISQVRKREIIVAGLACVILFAAALRGGEVFLLQESDLI